MKRHEQDEHGSKRGHQKRSDRLEKARRYKATTRHLDSPALSSKLSRVLVVIVCPARREDAAGLYSDARRSFLEHGFNSKQIRRTHGFDVEKNVPASFEAKDCRPSCFLSKYFFSVFLPRARQLFLQNPTAHSIYWAEDDCRLVDSKMLNRCSAVRPTWAGYYPLRGSVDGVPKWGSHLSPDGLNNLSCSC